MLIFGALLLNILITVIFYLRNPKEYIWYELVLSLVITTTMIIGAKALAERASVMFTEYWGETIVEVYEEEPYNWWHSKTCQQPCGTYTDINGNTQTEYCMVDCSEQEDEGPAWWCVTETGKKHRMTEKRYDEYMKLYGGDKIIVEKRKNHDSSDRCYYSKGTKFEGTKVGKYSYIYKTIWNKKEETRRGVFTKHRYENRVQASDISLFNLSQITQEEADSLGLYHYPEDFDIYTCPFFLVGEISEETQMLFRTLNAKYGPSNQFRLWILIFENEPIQKAIEQENYWVKGNKNELVVCIGINEQKEIQWSYSFSWATSSILTSEVKNKVLDLYEYNVETKKGETLPVAIPVNKDLKERVSEMTGLDTSFIPPILPLKDMGILNNEDVKNIVKSKQPMFNDRTLKEYYKYLDDNLDRFKRREFSEFYYLKTKPKKWHTILVFSLSIIISIFLNLWFSKNETRH